MFLWKQSVPDIHLFCARFKEQIGDVFGARAAFLLCGSDLEPDFIENVTRKANMEKRLVLYLPMFLFMCNNRIYITLQFYYLFFQGNVEAASIIYEKALDVAKEKQNFHALGILYAHFSYFTYMVLYLTFPL